MNLAGLLPVLETSGNPGTYCSRETEPLVFYLGVCATTCNSASQNAARSFPHLAGVVRNRPYQKLLGGLTTLKSGAILMLASVFSTEAQWRHRRGTAVFSDVGRRWSVMFVWYHLAWDTKQHKNMFVKLCLVAYANSFLTMGRGDFQRMVKTFFLM